MVEDLVDQYTRSEEGILIGVVAAPAGDHDDVEDEEGEEDGDEEHENAEDEGEGGEEGEEDEDDGEPGDRAAPPAGSGQGTVTRMTQSARATGGKAAPQRAQEGEGTPPSRRTEPRTLPEGAYSVGTVARVVQLAHLTRRGRSIGYTLHVRGVARIRLHSVLQTSPYLTVRPRLRPSRHTTTDEARALAITLRHAISDLVTQATELASAPQAEGEARGREEGCGAENGQGHARRRADRVLNQLADGAIISRLQATGASPGSSPEAVADLVGAALAMSLSERQRILETRSVPARLRLALFCARKQLEVLSLSRRIQEDVSHALRASQRRYLLEQQLKAIRKELRKAGVSEAEIGGDESDVGRLRARLGEADLPHEARKVRHPSRARGVVAPEVTDTELARLARTPQHVPEYQVLLSYLECLADLPWGRQRGGAVDVGQAREVLDCDHFGLELVKRRILEHLAVAALRRDARMPILCLLGPPGVGKTSIARSVARALDRPFRRISLGGVRDEAEIRGHRRTYIGAMPGLFIQHVRKAGAKDPLLLLDEVDKLGRDAVRGDPASALLEALDAEQNAEFVDHYVGTPFDLSRVFFIATANHAGGIPAPLLDRMEVIHLDGYTHEEKVQIARRHIIPRASREHALGEGGLAVHEDALLDIVTHYTQEAGVRGLQRCIAALCRHVAVQRADRGEAAGSGAGGESPPSKQPFEVTQDVVSTVLGAPLHHAARVDGRMGAAGVSIGLAWTPYGGRILFVETALVPRGSNGHGGDDLCLTGQAGDVMRESAYAALSWLRCHWSGAHDARAELASHFVHIHLPEGAVGKDGPSAGVAITVALASLLGGRRARADTAMSGEVTLAGRVLAVGGVKQKVLGAQLAGISRVVLPRANQRDVEDIPGKVLRTMSVVYVDTVEEALAAALERSPRRTEGRAASLPSARAPGGGAHVSAGAGNGVSLILRSAL